MDSNTCPRCRFNFFTAISGSELVCPFCGFFFRVPRMERRGQERVPLRRECDLCRDDICYRGQTIDVSRGGVCVSLLSTGGPPFDIGETVHMVVNEFDIDSDAKVVWTRSIEPDYHKMGLVFG